MSKKFLYLVQSASQLPLHYSALKSEQSDSIVLTWKEQVEGAIYFPKSTWTQGRNRLLKEALQQPDYLYYIFLDEDVIFEKGDWRKFESELLKYEPAIATPYFPEYNVPDCFHNISIEAHTCRQFDAIFNAFHKDVVKDKLILPYCGKFDKESWWYSQWFLVRLATLFYPNHTLQFNTVWINNTKHGEYPRSEEFEAGANWFNHEVLRRKPLTRLLHTLRDKIVYRIPQLASPRQPRPKLPTYHISRRQQSRKVRLNSEYWKTGKSL